MAQHERVLERIDQRNSLVLGQRVTGRQDDRNRISPQWLGDQTLAGIEAEREPSVQQILS